MKNEAKDEPSKALSSRQGGLCDQRAGVVANLAEVAVAVDVFSFVPVLQLVVFDVKP